MRIKRLIPSVCQRANTLRSGGEAPTVGCAAAAVMVGLVISLGAPVTAMANGVAFHAGSVLADVGGGDIREFSPTGTLLDTLETGTTAYEGDGMCFDGEGNLYATQGFGGNTVSEFSDAGELLTPEFGSGYNEHPESCVFDSSGHMYVGQPDGSHAVLEFDSSGNLLNSYYPEAEYRGTDWLSLATDQCTLRYTSEGSAIKAFDLCTNKQLPDFATGLPAPCYAHRILPDGGELVACESEVVRLNSNGETVQTYEPEAGGLLFALNLDPDGQTFWTAGYFSGEIYRINISTGEVVTSFSAGSVSPLGGLVVVGEVGAQGPWSRPWPVAGYGYSFPNRGMSEYARQAGLSISNILLPAELEQTFSDLNSNSIISGHLGGPQPPRTLLTEMWQAMNGGTCYGLALSGARFDAGAESLYAPSSGRSDPIWNVGEEPSSSMLLPEPTIHTNGSPPPYDEQFLRLDANDFLTQFSNEVQNDLNAQDHAYADPHTGVESLTEQMKSLLLSGKDLYDGSGRLFETPETGFALMVLMVKGDAAEPRGYGHAVLAYSLETLANGSLKIDVWDNNFPGEPHYILVKPNGTWSYMDAPYPVGSQGRLFGAEYTIGKKQMAGYDTGELDALPIYAPRGLHLFSQQGQGSTVDVAQSTTVTQAAGANGSEPDVQPVISGSYGYDGEILTFANDQSSVTLEGSEVAMDTRGSDDFLSVAGSGVTGPLQTSENVSSGSIEATGSPVNLDVARNDILTTSSGMTSLALSQAGAINGTANSQGRAEIVLYFAKEGTIASAALFSGATTPGQQLSFTPEQVAAAEAGRPQPPGPQPNSVSGAIKLVSTKLRVRRHDRRAAVRLKCTGTATAQSCTGGLVLTVRQRTGRARHARPVTIGWRQFAIPAGKAATINLVLRPLARKLLLAGGGQLRALLTIQPSPVTSAARHQTVRLVEGRSKRSG